MSDTTDIQHGLLKLPNEIILHIITFLSPNDIYFGMAQTNHGIRSIVRNNMKTMKLYDTHCLVSILDSIPGSGYRSDGTDPIISYTFTLFDNTKQDCEQKMRLCLRGNNTSHSSLHISHSQAAMNPQIAKGYGTVNISQNVAKTLLSYMNVRAIRFDVRKQCQNESNRKIDDFLLDCLSYCERMCTKVDVKSLLLCSKSALFPWIMGQKSLKKLSELTDLKSLSLENMMLFTAFNQIPLNNLCSLQLRLDARHKMDIHDQVTLAHINDGFLAILRDSAVHNIDFSAYSDSSFVVTSITSAAMCEFISYWKNTQHPWIIRSFSFNSTVSIQDFRDTLYHQSTYENVIELPYCRFQTIHKRVSTIALEISCYANGNATQWSYKTAQIK